MNENSSEADSSKRKWRKKRKNFLSNAKKYAKKGQMGRGSQISEDLFQYFVGILEVMKKGIETEEEKVALVNNVLEKTKGQELEIIGNQVGSRVIELLVPYASPDDLERLMELLHPELRRLCSDNFCSHVVEAVLKIAVERSTIHLQAVEMNPDTGEAPIKKQKIQEKLKYPQKHIEKCHDFALKISKFALNNLEEFVWDTYANHILRRVLRCLSGITKLPGEKPKINPLIEGDDKNKGIPPHETNITYQVVPQEFQDLVIEFANRLSSWPQFKDLPYQNITSGLLQILLYAAKNVDKHLSRSLLKKLLNESFAPENWVEDSVVLNNDSKLKLEEDAQLIKKESIEDLEDAEIDNRNNHHDSSVKDCMKDQTEYDFKKKEDVGNRSLPPAFKSEAAVRLLEVALFVAKKKSYTQIYARCFINRLGQLATMPSLNYTVQRLFDNCQVKEEFEPMFDELSEKLNTILSSGNTGVLVAIAKACHRLKSRQAQFFTSLEKALNCVQDQKFLAACTLQLLPKDRMVQYTSKPYFINIHGSIIAQTMLGFQRPGPLVQSLLDMEAEELVMILQDAKGCHIADAFCVGEFVGVKARDKLVWKLKGRYQALALSQYGSRAFEAIFNASSLEQKCKIMTEITEKVNLLNGTLYGRVVAAKLNVDLFTSNLENWKRFINKGKPVEVKEDGKVHKKKK